MGHHRLDGGLVLGIQPYFKRLMSRAEIASSTPEIPSTPDAPRWWTDVACLNVPTPRDGGHEATSALHAALHAVSASRLVNLPTYPPVASFASRQWPFSSHATSSANGHLPTLSLYEPIFTLSKPFVKFRPRSRHAHGGGAPRRVTDPSPASGNRLIRLLL